MKSRVMSRTVILKTLFIVITGAITVVSGVQFYRHRHYQVPVVAGPGSPVWPTSAGTARG